MLLGRSAEVSITLPAQTVSRQHAQVFADPFGRWWIKDLGSRNGTLVNHQRIQDDYLLEPGDQIHIEEFSLSYEVQGQAPQRARAKAPAISPNLTVTLSDSDPQSISRLDQLVCPKIDAAHLSSLTAFSTELLATQDDHQRMVALTQLLVNRNFHGRSALAFTLDLTQPDTPPAILVEPQSNQNWRRHEQPYLSRTLLKAVRQDRTPVIASNVDTSADIMKLSLAGDVQQLAALACPLKITDHTMDVLYVTFPGEFGTPEWLALAALAADLHKQADEVWIARRKAQEQAILEKELLHASNIQKALIPKSVQIPGIDGAIGFEPCKWVGGDYVDVFAAPNGKIYLTLCDVCGKGMQAAIITASLHAMFRTTAAAAMPLTQLMEKMNEYLVQTLPDESFVTAIGMVYDPETGQFRTCNAGHPPAIIVNTEGKATQLESAQHPPLGFIHTPFTVENHLLPPGAILCLYTDGLTESVNIAGEMLGIEGVEKLLEQTYPKGANQNASTLRNTFTKLLDDYEGQALRTDDRTFLLLKRLP